MVKKKQNQPILLLKKQRETEREKQRGIIARSCDSLALENAARAVSRDAKIQDEVILVAKKEHKTMAHQTAIIPEMF